MAITTTITCESYTRNKRLVAGISVLSGTASTGDVATGLSIVDVFTATILNSNGGYIVNIDETFPLASGDVSIKTNGNDYSISWIAIGS
jgi:hypothetical protein